MIKKTLIQILAPKVSMSEERQDHRDTNLYSQQIWESQNTLYFHPPTSSIERLVGELWNMGA